MEGPKKQVLPRARKIDLIWISHLYSVNYLIPIFIILKLSLELSISSSKWNKTFTKTKAANFQSKKNRKQSTLHYSPILKFTLFS